MITSDTRFTREIKSRIATANAAFNKKNILRNILRTIKRRKANWIGHVLRRNCLVKHVIDGKIEERSNGNTRKKM
jgi:hypothetical protein